MIDKACPKQKEIIVNKNNPCHSGTLKQLRFEKFARYEEYSKDRTNIDNKTKYYKTLNKYRRLQTKTEKTQKRPNRSYGKRSRYKILKNKAKKDIGTLKKQMATTRLQE